VFVRVRSRKRGDLRECGLSEERICISRSHANPVRRFAGAKRDNGTDGPEAHRTTLRGARCPTHWGGKPGFRRRTPLDRCDVEAIMEDRSPILRERVFRRPCRVPLDARTVPIRRPPMCHAAGDVAWCVGVRGNVDGRGRCFARDGAGVVRGLSGFASRSRPEPACLDAHTRQFVGPWDPHLLGTALRRTSGTGADSGGAVRVANRPTTGRTVAGRSPASRESCCGPVVVDCALEFTRRRPSRPRRAATHREHLNAAAAGARRAWGSSSPATGRGMRRDGRTSPTPAFRELPEPAST
jgi:hypothetical protein